MKKAILILIKVVFVAAAIYWLVDKMGVTPERISEVFSQLDLGHAAGWLLFAAVIKLAGIFCGVVRWRLLLTAQQIELPFWYLTKAWFMGRAIGLFLPGTVGLDGYRLVESAAYTGQPMKCATVVVVEKLTGFVALFTLVFLTLPLGTRVFEFNVPVLAAVLAFLAFCIGAFFLVLMNPRVLQIIVAVIPVPAKLKDKADELSEAVAAYRAHRGRLLVAILFGLGVHLGICLMYFGTAMAISGGRANIGDVLFASPLVIVFSIIAPTVSGLGVREGGFALLLGGVYGTAEAAISGHLGLWVGEAVPFLLSLPLLLFAGRPDKAAFNERLEAVKKETAHHPSVLRLEHEEMLQYRSRVFGTVFAGLFAGLIAAGIFGLAEAWWHVSHLAQKSETVAYVWATLAYAPAGLGIGVGVAGALLFLYLLFDKFMPSNVTAALSAAGTVAALGLVIGMFRYRRDVLAEAAMQGGDYIKVVGGAVIAGAVVGAFIYVAAIAVGKVRIPTWALAIAGYVAVVAIGGVLTVVTKPSLAAPEFTATPGASGPNIVLVAVDTLRADYLKPYQFDAAPNTPNLDSFFGESLVFQNAFAQSSWTKASFGTIFSGMYPEAHTAWSKVSSLPESVTTIAEVLRDGGYYTRGYSNNGNIASTFNYDQGFVHYTDLTRDLYFGATPSCEKLVIYDIMRMVYQRVTGKIFKERIRIEDFYQPAESVANEGMAWLDGENRPGDTPFFLFLHFMDPHDPFRDPERPGKGYARVQMKNPDPEKYTEAFKRSYTYEIEYLDGHLGRFFDGLKERGLFDNTLIIFTSDHGEEFYEHGGFWHGLSLYEEQIHIPLALKLPGNVRAGDMESAMVRHVDLAPTLALISKTEPGELWQGNSIFTDTNNYATSTDTLLNYSHGHLNFETIELRSVRTETHKLIRANEGNKRGFEPIELYDILGDPGEQVNLVSDASQEDYRVSLDATLDEMNEFIAGNAVAPEIRDPETMTDEEKEALKAIGYGDVDSPTSEE